jgi:hypothetical protein
MAVMLKQLSKTQKLRLALAIVASGLVFYAVGIATDFFANPIFAPFFIISYQTAHEIVTYLAITIAIALTISYATIYTFKKRKTKFKKSHNKPTIPTIKTINIGTVAIAQQTSNGMITNFSETTEEEQEKQLTKQFIKLQAKGSTTQESVKTSKNKTNSTNQEPAAKENTDKIVCPACKKEFSTPLFMVDYTNSKPRLVRHCPYCDQSLDEVKDKTPEAAEEDFWSKYFKPS